MLPGTDADGRAAGRLVFARTPAGEPVAECELAACDLDLLPGLAGDAARSGYALLWVHSTADLSGAGFTPRQGYRRFAAASISPGDPLPLLDSPTVLGLLPQAFIGQWGHHEFDAEWACAPQARYVGLGQPGSWTGLCRFERQRRHIDGPGFVIGSGSPQVVRQLVFGAIAHLGPGPVTAETWGEPPDAYLAMGFDIAEECGGWERALIP